MKLSIVIPAKNEEKYLPQLLQSIRGQSFTDYEIIVADAGSTDRTREAAESFGARLTGGGLPGPGRNRGAEVAQGEVFFFFDSDVVLPHPDFLKDCLDEMERRGLDVASPRVAPLEGNLTDDFFHEVYNLYSVATEKVLPHAPGFCMFAKANTHRAINGFDERVVFAEDHYYALRAHQSGLKVGILRGPKIGVSVRRLEKEGRLKFALKYLYAELRIRLFGPIKDKMPFEYEFANFDQPSDAEHPKTPAL